jgi:hypothetical protein
MSRVGKVGLVDARNVAGFMGGSSPARSTRPQAAAADSDAFQAPAPAAVADNTYMVAGERMYTGRAARRGWLHMGRSVVMGQVKHIACNDPAFWKRSGTRFLMYQGELTTDTAQRALCTATLKAARRHVTSRLASVLTYTPPFDAPLLWRGL